MALNGQSRESSHHRSGRPAVLVRMGQTMVTLRRGTTSTKAIKKTNAYMNIVSTTCNFDLPLAACVKSRHPSGPRLSSGAFLSKSIKS